MTTKSAAAILAASFFFAAPAAAGPVIATGEWAAMIAHDLGFRQGILLRQDYRSRGDAYLDIQSSYIHSLHEPLLRRAGQDPKLTAMVLNRMRGMYADVEGYVRFTEDGIFHLLDPDGDGTAELEGSLAVLAEIAGRADLDGDGRLDRGEQMLAEAALARGSNLSDPALKSAMVHAFAVGGPE